MFIRSKTYEWDGSKWKLVLVHEFHGDTLEEAQHVLEAHLKSDAFFRGCTVGPPYKGIECHTESEIVR